MKDRRKPIHQEPKLGKPKQYRCGVCGKPAMGGDPPAVYLLCEICWRQAVGEPRG